MSLRGSVFLAVLLVVGCTTAMEALLDVVIDRFGDERLFLDLLDVPATLLIAGVGAWLLARRISRPLKELTRATHAVATLTPVPATLRPTGQDELAELVTSFNEMAAAVEAAVERERAFTRYASHELRTPLSAMRLQLERLELGAATTSDVLPALARGVARLEEIIAALLSLARESDGAGDPRPAAAVLSSVIDALPAPDRRRVNVHGNGCSALVRNPRLFQRAVVNLVDNALRHGAGTTNVRLSASGGRLILRVEDDGPGLAPPALERVTEALNRGPAREDGHGLGLSFVAFLAKALGGDLRLTSAGAGLRAELSLPIAAGPEGAPGRHP